MVLNQNFPVSLCQHGFKSSLPETIPGDLPMMETAQIWELFAKLFSEKTSRLISQSLVVLGKRLGQYFNKECYWLRFPRTSVLVRNLNTAIEWRHWLLTASLRILFLNMTTTLMRWKMHKSELIMVSTGVHLTTGNLCTGGLTTMWEFLVLVHWRLSHADYREPWTTFTRDHWSSKPSWPITTSQHLPKLFRITMLVSL